MIGKYFAIFQLVKSCLVLLLLFSNQAFCYESGDIIVRMGYANIDFREDSGSVRINDALDLGELSVESQRTPLITFATMFNEQWGVEVLIPFSPFELQADGKGGFIDGLPLGTADVWPLAITFQYRPFEFQWAKPYIGIGANYTFINNEQVNENTAFSLGMERIESVDADDSIGMVFQVGVDFPVTHNLMINLSSTHLDLNLDATGTFYANGALSTISGNMSLKMLPNLTVVGISYRF